MADVLSTAWNLVNSAETKAQLSNCENYVRTNIKDNDDFDDLMMAISFKWRERHLG